MGYKLQKNSKRFLCLERITLRIDFDGNTLPEYVIFYPVGSSSAKVYITKISNTKGYAQLVYNMGIVMSSITWGDLRVRPSYQCNASAFYGNVRKDFMLSGIEITGDVYDLVYVQIAPSKARKLKD